MLHVKFRAFRGIDEPATCERFIEGHRKVLEIYDIKMISSNKTQWTNHENTYLIVAESLDDGRIYGGLRIQIADDKLKLPIEDAVGVVDKRIHDVVKQFSVEHTGEMCGLWNSREIAGYGVGSTYLGWSGIVLARVLGLKSLMALCAPATVRMSKEGGFDIERSLGQNGFFNYPKLDLIATAMIIRNVSDLSHARENVRTIVESIYNEPDQVLVFNSPKGDISIQFDLNIKRHTA